MPGKKEAFTPEENAVLRAELSRYRAEHRLSQSEIGELLGIKQQNVGRFERGAGGLGRQTANKLAVLAGFRDAEDLLLDRGVLAEMKELPAAGAAWTRRDWAVRMARSASVDEAAIQAVISRYTDDSSRVRLEKWWLMKFTTEDQERQADRAAQAPSARAAIAPPRSPRKRRKAG